MIYVGMSDLCILLLGLLFEYCSNFHVSTVIHDCMYEFCVGENVGIPFIHHIKGIRSQYKCYFLNTIITPITQ